MENNGDTRTTPVVNRTKPVEQDNETVTQQTNANPDVQENETVTQQTNTRPEAQYNKPVTHKTETVNTFIEGQNARRIIGVVFGTIEVIIAGRFLLKLFGANPDSGFVRAIYAVTGIFVNIFNGIFAETIIGGSESRAVFEPASIIAMIVIALIALLVFKLMTPKDKTTEQTSYTSNTRPGNK
jgi:hypothetical protein